MKSVMMSRITRHLSEFCGTIMFRGVMIVAAVCGIWLFVMPNAAVSAAPEQMITYSVRPGDTLWSYASMITEQGSSIADSVDLLMRINHLDTPELSVGQRLLVPLVQEDDIAIK